MTVSMAMVVHKQQADTAGDNCPSCAAPYTGSKGKDLARVRW